MNTDNKRYKILHRGHWPAGAVRVEGARETEPWPVALQRQAAEFWQEMTAQNARLFNGPLVSLRAAAVANGHLALTLGETCYRDVVFSNAHVQTWLAEGKLELPARALGISALVETRDRRLLLIRRSAAVGEYPGMLDVIGGHIHPEEHTGDGGLPDVFDAIHDEAMGELGIAFGQIVDTVCIGMVENVEICKPELVFRLQLGVDVAQIRVLSATARERFEYVELESITADAIAVDEFLQHRGWECTPSAEGCLALYRQVLAEDK